MENRLEDSQVHDWASGHDRGASSGGDHGRCLSAQNDRLSPSPARRYGRGQQRRLSVRDRRNCRVQRGAVQRDVPEGMSQTSFTPTSDLASGAMFYWRVRAADSATGVTSGYSSTQRFTTVTPIDGSLPYVFHLHAPSNNNSSCQLRFGPDYDTRSYPTDLVVSGDALRFTVFWTDYTAPNPSRGSTST